jgi:hypothetical protein
MHTIVIGAEKCAYRHSDRKFCHVIGLRFKTADHLPAVFVIVAPLSISSADVFLVLCSEFC